MIKQEFDIILKKIEEKVILADVNMIPILKQRNADCTAKLQYVLELLGTRVVDLRDKVREGKDIGLSK